MKIALIGASGYVGSALRDEALARGHQVSALAGHPEKLPAHPKLTALKVDVMNEQALADKLRKHHAVISAFSGHAQPDVRAYYVQGMRHILNAVRLAGVPRLLVVGGAGALNVGPGQALLDTPDFPKEWKATAEGARDALTLLRACDLDWTMLAPSAMLEPGRRTGQFRLGKDDLLVDDKGDSRISTQDYAMAMLDEVERPRHTRMRFTVGY